MKITTPDLSHERRLLIAAITDTQFISQLRPILDPTLLESDYSTTVLKWCLDYYDKTSQAPAREIKHIYDLKSGELQSQESRDLTATFLASISEEFEQTGKMNTEYSVSVATEYLRRRKLHALKDKLEAALGSNDLAAGEQFVATYRRPEQPKIGGIRLFKDAAKVQSAFEDVEADTLFRFPQDALDELIGPIGRGDFMAFAAPYKTGKSFWADFTGRTAAMQGCKVVYYGLEMTEKQLVRRGYRSIEGASLRSKKQGAVPYFTHDGRIEQQNKDLEGLLETGTDVARTLRNMRMLARGGDILYRQFGPNTFSVKDLYADLDNMEYFEGYKPDVVVIDGADNMRCDNGRLEGYHRLDDIWMNLAQVRTNRNIAIVTVSHVEASKKDSGGGKSNNVTGAKSKNNHITHMVNLNQTPNMRSHNFLYVTMDTVRDGESRNSPVCVLEQRDIGRVCIDARWAEETNAEELLKYDRLKGNGFS